MTAFLSSLYIDVSRKLLAIRQSKGAKDRLLESGVNLRLIQQWLGHSSLSTTARYTHLTRNAETVAGELIDQLMSPLLTTPVWRAVG